MVGDHLQNTALNLCGNLDIWGKKNKYESLIIEEKELQMLKCC
jgi:hypothetical protein